MISMCTKIIKSFNFKCTVLNWTVPGGSKANVTYISMLHTVQTFKYHKNEVIIAT